MACSVFFWLDLVVALFLFKNFFDGHGFIYEGQNPGFTGSWDSPEDHREHMGFDASLDVLIRVSWLYYHTSLTNFVICRRTVAISLSWIKSDSLDQR